MDDMSASLSLSNFGDDVRFGGQLGAHVPLSQKTGEGVIS